MDAQPGELRRAALVGVRWLATARLCGHAVSIAAAIVLAHLVSPAEFGRAAIALVVARLAHVLVGQGFGAPLVQRPELTPAHIVAARRLSVLCGFGLAAVAAGALAVVMSGPDPRLAGMLQLSSLALVLAGLGSVPQALLQRRLDFRRLSLIDVASHVGGGVASLAFALAGLGGYALVLGALTTMALGAALLHLGLELPRGRLERAATADILRFGAPATGSSLLTGVWQNVDYVVIGLSMPAAVVGLYYRAFTFAVSGQRKLTGIVAQLAFPLYSRADRDGQLQRIRMRVIRMQAAVVFPSLAVLAATAPALVPWVFGEQWAGAVVATQILTLSGMMSCVAAGTGPLLLASGRPGALLCYHAFQVALFVAVLVVTAPLGLTAVAWGVVGVYLVSLAVLATVVYERVLGIPARAFASEVGPGVALAIAAAAAAFPAMRALEALGAAAGASVLIAAAAGLLAAVAVGRLALPELWADGVRLAREALSTREQPAGERRARRSRPEPSPEVAGT